MLTQEHKQELRQYLNVVRKAANVHEVNLNHNELWLKQLLEQANAHRIKIGKAALNMIEFREAISCFRQLEGL
jgi:hypothetical protein